MGICYERRSDAPRPQKLKLEIEQSQIPAQGRAALWICPPEYGDRLRRGMRRRLRRLLAETFGAEIGRLRICEFAENPEEILRAMERAEFDSCVVFVPAAGWERTAVELLAAAHRSRIHVVLVSFARPDPQAYPADLLSELDLVIVDSGTTLQLRQPDGEILAETPWSRPA